MNQLTMNGLSKAILLIFIGATTVFWTSQAYVAHPLHATNWNFYPNRCGHAGFGCCNGKIQCYNRTQEEHSCRQDSTSHNWCHIATCNPKCREGYFCQHQNLCVLVNKSISTYEQVDFTCPQSQYGYLYRWGRGSTKWKNNKVYQCQWCPNGLYSPAINNDTTCAACPAGEYAYHRRECRECTKNHVSYKGSYRCWHKNCPPGTYHDGGEKSCTLCEKGRYSSQWGADSIGACEACPPGKYSDLLGRTDPTHCKECPAGKSNPTPAANSISQCIECAVGLKSGGGQTACQGACTPGFHTTSSPSMCADCPRGRFNEHFEQPGCAKCPKGRFFSGIRGKSEAACQNCTAGKFAAQTGQHGCNDCPAGLFSTVGSETCSKCPAGRWSSSVRLASPMACTACAKGKYSNILGATQLSACKECDPGRYNEQMGQSECTACAAGKANALTGRENSEVCLACEAGSKSAMGQAECDANCYGGAFPDGSDASKCNLCPAGRSGGGNAVTSTDPIIACHECAPGLFAEPGSVECFGCDKGTYSGAAAGMCTACIGGKYGPLENATTENVCLACPLTTYSIGGASSCTRCPAGQFSGTGASKCSACPAGKARQDNSISKAYYRFSEDCRFEFSYFNTVGPVGILYEGLAEEWKPWKIVSNGEYPDGFGNNCHGAKFSGSFQILQTGTYRFRTNSDDDSHLFLDGEHKVDNGGPHGMRIRTSGNINLNKGDNVYVEVLWFNGGGGWGLITEVDVPGEGWKAWPNGATAYFGPVPRSNGTDPSDFCASCIPGKFAEDEGAGVCEYCPPGAFVGGIGSKSCQECIPGKYSNSIGLTHVENCTDCAIGTASDALGRGEACDGCEAGQYADREGLSLCRLCPGGKVSQEFASETDENCKVCASGSSALAGSSECTECVPGRAGPTPGMEKCDLCPQGKYSKAGKEDCFDCRPGSYSAYNNSLPRPCTQCQEGQYTMVSGAASCEKCPRNTYANDIGTAKCPVCSGNSWTEHQEGASSCVPCNVGQVFPYANNSGGNCEFCMAGRYSLIAGETFAGCHACPEGAFCDGGNHLQVLPGWWRSTGCNETSGTCGDVRDMPRQCDADHADCEGNTCACRQREKFRGVYYDRCGVKRIITKCTSPHFCIGNGTCREGHRGPLCLLCAEDFFKTGGQCETCSTSSPASASRVFVIFLLAFTVFVATVYQIAKRSQRLKKYTPVWKDIMRSLKIYVSHMQICQGLQGIYPIDWGDGLINFFGMFAPVNMDLLDVTSVGCQVTLTFYMSYIFVVIVMPLCLAGVIYFYYRMNLKFIAKRLKDKHEQQETDHRNERAGIQHGNGINRFKAAVKHERNLTKVKMQEATRHAVKEMHLENTVTSLGFQAAVLIHTPIARKTFQFANCIDVGDCSYFMNADPRILCYTTEWWVFSALVIFVGIFFVLGLPIGLWIYLWKKRKIKYGGSDTGLTGLDAPNVIAKVGFTFSPYRKVAYFWESEEMLRKMFLSGALVYLSNTPALQCGAALVCCLFTHVLHAAYKPWKNKLIYEMQHALLFASFVTFLIGLLSIAQVDTVEQEAAIKTTLLVVHVGVVVIGFVAMGYSGVVAVRNASRIHGQVTKEDAANRSSAKVTPVQAATLKQDNVRGGAGVIAPSAESLQKIRKKYGAASKEYKRAAHEYKQAKSAATKVKEVPPAPPRRPGGKR